MVTLLPLHARDRPDATRRSRSRPDGSSGSRSTPKTAKKRGFPRVDTHGRPSRRSRCSTRKPSTVAYSWIGAVDARELVRVFDEAETAYRTDGRRGGILAVEPPTGSCSRSLAGKNDECARRALELLPTLPPDAVKATRRVDGPRLRALCAAEAARRGVRRRWRRSKQRSGKRWATKACSTTTVRPLQRLVDARDRQGTRPGPRPRRRRGSIGSTGQARTRGERRSPGGSRRIPRERGAAARKRPSAWSTRSGVPSGSFRTTTTRPRGWHSSP